MKVLTQVLSGLSLSLMLGCNPSQTPDFKVVDTDFSKGRLTHEQVVTLKDLEKFHGHLCDGLVIGALAIGQAMDALYPDQAIDRTNLRIVSKPSPCLTDAAIYLTGGRYQFNTFYVDPAFAGTYIIQRIDNRKTVSVSLREGVKPTAIDSLGALAVHQQLAPCDLDKLKKLEDDFTEFLLQSEAASLFSVTDIPNFTWDPSLNNSFIKTDILNKGAPECR